MAQLMSRRIAFYGGLGVGAGLMHALAPARRARWPQLNTRPGDGSGHAPWPDDLIAARVRAAVARAASYPHAIDVSVDQGVVTLRGPVLERELQSVLRRAARVAGVRSVDSELNPSSAASEPRLRGRTQRDRSALERDVWPLSWRLAAGSVGLAVGRIGLALARRRIAGGLALSAGGAALVARAASNRPLRGMLHLGKASHVVDMRRTVLVRAPVSEVFRFWAQVENFPLFMEHVLEVAVNPRDGRRSHWQVRGPGGLPVKWDAEVTRVVPDALFAWKTLPGSSVEHAGAVHFEPLGPETTWLQVHMVYVPPAGALGQLLATVVGGDPESRMEEDLARLKSLVEDLHALAPGGQPAPAPETTQPARR
jgi:uncharacterized membrane protein